jgi:argininosuccinate synthase
MYSRRHTATILTCTLTALAMNKQVMRVRDSLSLEWARLCYNGFWFAPEMELVKNAMNFASKVSSYSYAVVRCNALTGQCEAICSSVKVEYCVVVKVVRKSYYDSCSSSKKQHSELLIRT